MQDLLLAALKFYGTKEIAGKEHNSLIADWNNRLMSWVFDDEVSWCSSFINAIAKEAGYEYSGSPAARSWLKVGEETTEIEAGTVLVFWRKSPASWQGHVALYVSESDTHYYVLGGNQANEVNIMPYAKSRFLGARKLRKLENVVL